MTSAHSEAMLAARRVERVYLSGPMTGLPEHNVPKFEAVAAALRATGFEIVSPVEIGLAFFGDCGGSVPPEAYLRRDLRELLSCSAIVLMDGWERSVGARCEAAIAVTLGFTFYDERGNRRPAPAIITITGGYKKEGQANG